MGVLGFIRSWFGDEGVLGSGYPFLPREVRFPPAPPAKERAGAAGAASGEVRYTGRISPPSAMLISSGRVERCGDHDHVSLWSRGGHAGELCLRAGDGHLLLSWLGLERVPIRRVADPVLLEDSE